MRSLREELFYGCNKGYLSVEASQMPDGAQGTRGGRNKSEWGVQKAREICFDMQKSSAPPKNPSSRLYKGGRREAKSIRY